ncbi:MAG: tetratricopeptide repeat protein [Armatimonadota bacterium]|nr:tetratricopeptide repeat protein [Armatimonadota bacterium]
MPQLIAMSHKDTQDSQLMGLLGARLAQSGDYTAAAWVLKNAATLGDADPLLWLTWSAAEAMAGRRARSLAVLQLGNGHRIAGLQDMADRAAQLPPDVSPVQVASAIAPDGPEPLLRERASGSFLNGIVEWWGRKHPEASGFATRENWVKEEPDNAAVECLWGEALLTNHDLPHAAKAIQHALDLNPRSADIHLSVGHLLAAEGRNDAAGKEYQLCLQMRPRWLPALLGLAKSELQQDNYINSIDMFEQATRQAPDSIEAWLGLGQACFRVQARLSESIAAYQKAVKLAPDRTDFYADYADTLRMNYQLPESENILRQRLRQSPNDARAHYLLGVVISHSRAAGGQLKDLEAERELRTALDLAPDNPEVKTELARVLLRQRKAAEALALLQDALSVNPLDVPGRNLLAQAFQQLGRRQESNAASEKAVEIAQNVAHLQVLVHRAQSQPADIDNHVQLAKLYRSLGQNDHTVAEMQVVERLRSQSASSQPSSPGQSGSATARSGGSSR